MPSSPASQFRVSDGVGVRLRLPVEISRPVVHQAATAFEEITARVGLPLWGCVPYGQAGTQRSIARNPCRRA